MRYAVAMDVGGTSLNSGLVREDGFISTESIYYQPIQADGSKESILASFATTLNQALEYAEKNHKTVSGIAISIGGPFDYAEGISQIKDLDKFESIYGVNVKQELKARLELSSSLAFVFDVDAWCFARGEAWRGVAEGFKRIIVFTLGTGVGSAFVADGVVLGEGAGVPWLGWVSGQAYKEGILNDYVSRTYMIKRFEALSGERLDVKAIAEAAYAGNENAKQVFNEVASELAEFIKDRHVIPFKADCIVLGGQIAKAFELYKGPLELILKEVNTLKAILPAKDIELSALRGAAKLIFEA